MIAAGAARGSTLLDADPNFCFAYDGEADAFIVKLWGDEGSVVWGKTFGTAANEQIRDLPSIRMARRS